MRRHTCMHTCRTAGHSEGAEPLPTLSLHAHHSTICTAEATQARGRPLQRQRKGPCEPQRNLTKFSKTLGINTEQPRSVRPREQLSPSRPLCGFSVRRSHGPSGSGPGRGSLVLREWPLDGRPAAPWRSHSQGWLASTWLFNDAAAGGIPAGKPEADEPPSPHL